VLRDLRESDVPILREIYSRTGYGFDFPDLSYLFHKHGKRKGRLHAKKAALVVEDDEGRVVGMVMAQVEAQIIGVFEPSWATPGERMRTFAQLHRPIAEKLKKHGVREVYVALDPKFPAFGRRLMSLGWRKALWAQYFLSVKDCLARFCGKEAGHR
jgi:hypothetical protein